MPYCRIIWKREPVLPTAYDLSVPLDYEPSETATSPSRNCSLVLGHGNDPCRSSQSSRSPEDVW